MQRRTGLTHARSADAADYRLYIALLVSSNSVQYVLPKNRCSTPSPKLQDSQTAQGQKEASSIHSNAGRRQHATHAGTNTLMQVHASKPVKRILPNAARLT